MKALDEKSPPPSDLKVLIFRLSGFSTVAWKYLKMLKTSDLNLKKVNPFKLREIIIKNKVVFKVIHRSYRCWIPYVTMNALKRHSRNRSRFIKRKLMHLATETVSTVCYNIIGFIEHIKRFKKR